MKYEIINVESDGIISQYVIIDLGDNRFTSIPVDESNQEYLNFLNQIK